MGRSNVKQQDESLRDVVVVGAGAAGLSAALTLTRARRTVAVVDAGQPRNAPSRGVHGLLGHEGVAPTELLARGREEVRGYGGELVDGEVVDVSCTSYGFAVTLDRGDLVRGRRLLIATGLVDEMPDVPGVREQWGHGVLHCPFCHGWEVRDQRIGVLATDPMGVHKAVMFHQWSNDIVLFAGDQVLDDTEHTQLDALGITVVEGAIDSLETEGDLLRGVRVAGRSGGLADGQVVEVDAVVVSTRMVARAEPFAGIGIELTEHPMGAFIESNEFGKTAVPGVWAAGNASDLGAQVSNAAAEGARAAQHINADLTQADLERAVAAATAAITAASVKEQA